MMVLLWLAEFVGLKGLKGISVGVVKWSVRLAALVVLVWITAVYPQWLVYALDIAALWVLWSALGWTYRQRTPIKWTLCVVLLVAAMALCAVPAQEYPLPLALSTLAIAALQWWRHRHRKVAVARTIDGKLVPEKLAAAALAVPKHSPSGEYVLRGLPDFGKGLLRLDANEFEYLPEIPGAASELLPVAEEAAVRQPWRTNMPRLRLAAGVVTVLIIAGMAIRIHESRLAHAQFELKHAKLEASMKEGTASFVKEEQAKIKLRDSQTPASGQLSTDGLTWADDKTGLIWTTMDNGKPINWHEAKNYCSALTLNGRRDWRLPKEEELEDLWTKKEEHPNSAPDYYFELGHGFKLSDSPMVWTASCEFTPADNSTPNCIFQAHTDEIGVARINNVNPDAKENTYRAICVSGPR